jgi:class 3 adenylate cyclase
MFQHVLEVYAQALAEIAGRYDGSVERAGGEAIVALFGEPAAGLDATSRAVRAALEMQDAVRRLRAEWRARFGVEIGGLDIGIARGPVIVGSLGTPPARYETAIGDAVNRAVRLRALARAGEILVAAEVATALDPAGPLYAIEPLQPLFVRGVAPEHIYRIGEPARRKAAN